MFKHCSTPKTLMVLILAFSLFATAFAAETIIRFSAQDYEEASLKIKTNIEIIAEESGMILARCDASAIDIFNDYGFTHEVIKSSEHIYTDDLSPEPESGLPLGVVVKRGSQGAAGWHQGVAMAGNVLAYKETDVEGQLSGFTFWDMEKDSTWHHYIDTELEGDEPLFMAAGKNKICYAFHFMNPAISNSDMRWYWVDVSTGEQGEAENFGYGFEGFGVSDTWMMRVGNKGMGWNNQILAHNMETGERFEIVADSILDGPYYRHDNFGGPRTGGNTIVHTYTKHDYSTTDLKVFSLGADGEVGTADDVHGTLSQSGTGHTATGYGQYRVDGRYIVWVERITGDDGNIKGFDMGPDELFGTADDVGAFDICLDPAQQSMVRINGDVVVWEDMRNTTTGNDKDIYGYDISTSTGFRSTISTQKFGMADFVNGEVVMVKDDWDSEPGHNDIYLMNIYGIIQGEYYHIDMTGGLPPMAHSYLTGHVETSPRSFGSVVGGVKGPLSAVFIDDGIGNAVALAYSAVTGNWSTDILSAGPDEYTAMIDGDNAMIIGAGSSNYIAYTFNGASGTFSSKNINIPKPTGFATGRNISFVWGDDSTYHWIEVYDAATDTWTGTSANTNDPWHVVATDFSDSLALILHAQGDTICDHTQVQVYDLELHDWVSMGLANHLNEINIYEWEKTVQMDANAHFAIVTQEDDRYNDYIYTYGTGKDEWKAKPMYSGPVFEKSFLGENFIVQGTRSGDIWRGYIYNGLTHEWLPDYIESINGIDRLITYPDLMLAWYENAPSFAKLWAYSSNADGIQEMTIQYPGPNFTVKAAEKAAYVLASNGNSIDDFMYVFNGLKGEWAQQFNVRVSQFVLEASGHTGVFLNYVGLTSGTKEWEAYGYSAFRDEWDMIEIRSNRVDGISASDFCGLIHHQHWYYHSDISFKAFNAMEAKWSADEIKFYENSWTGFSMNDRIMMLVEDNPSDYTYGKVHVFSPILDRWNTMEFDTPSNYSIDQCMTTPTSAFAWNENEFRIIYSPDIEWQEVTGSLEELHVTDYAISALIGTTWHNFYPPRTEIITEFKITEGPDVNILSSWAAEISWKTNMNSDTRLVWGVDGYYGIIEQDTLEEDYTKDHRILIEGLEANETYYYGAVSIINGIDTAHSDTLDFSTGADNTPPILTGAPEAYRIHDDQASVWWETNEPSTAILCWGLTTAYTDTLSYDGSANLTNAIRMYDLIKDTTYHYQVGGYDRYGNGPFYSGDYTFRTSNPLPVVTDLSEADSTLYGAAYMTWEPPRYDSTLAKETFNNGIPVDWKIYNLGDSKKGSTWTSGYSGNNPIAYCNYSGPGERQEEWLITNPITIDGSTGGVLNFWHQGFYTSYDNAPNKVMVSWTGTNTSDFTTVWSSQNLPDEYWDLVQIDMDWSTNYGKTMYVAFVYESTNGEIWAIDNVYMDFDVDGFYDDCSDLNSWTNHGGTWGLKNVSGNYCLGVDGIRVSTNLPDPITTWDAWEISQSFKVTESHNILGFWQMGWSGEYDTQPNEVRVVYDASNPEFSSQVVSTVYPVPNGWRWTTIDLSAYINQTIKIGFRYHSNVGWYWNGEEWYAYWGEDWYIDDVQLYENAPAMVEDPNALPNEKPMKFASKPNGRPIPLDEFTSISSTEPEKEMLTTEAPEGAPKLPEEKPLHAIELPAILSEPAPSGLAAILPKLLGYEIFGKFENDQHYIYKGYVSSPSFVDWNTYLGAECEYYVEAVYDQGNSQPSNKTIIKGGNTIKANEYAFDTGRLYYSYWWYQGTSFANEFFFQDSALDVAKIKVHVANPGNFRVRLSTYDNSGAIQTLFTSNTIPVTSEQWVEVNVPATLEPESEFLVEFMPQDTLVKLSYDAYDFDFGVSWFYNGTEWSSSNDVFFIRLIGELSPIVATEDIPEEFKLAQNYPNPFNPTTAISYQLSADSDVELAVYDISGRMVRTLINERQSAGYHTVNWNATNMNGADVASGVYLIRMTAGEFVETRKMVLVR